MRIDNLKDWPYRSLLTAAMVTLAVLGAPVLARGVPAPSARVRDLAIGTCGACHGVDGNTTNPMFPRLAGQHAGYLAQQLREFKDHKRSDPDALAYMYGMASPLSNATIEALAQYFARQTAGPGKRHATTEVAVGNRIYHQGIAAQGVPACSACHGPGGLGNKQFPRLAGQHAEYIVMQLRYYRHKLRQGAVMQSVAAMLHRSQRRAVADYLASLR